MYSKKAYGLGLTIRLYLLIVNSEEGYHANELVNKVTADEGLNKEDADAVLLYNLWQRIQSALRLLVSLEYIKRETHYNERNTIYFIYKHNSKDVKGK